MQRSRETLDLLLYCKFAQWIMRSCTCGAFTQTKVKNQGRFNIHIKKKSRLWWTVSLIPVRTQELWEQSRSLVSPAREGSCGASGGTRRWDSAQKEAASSGPGPGPGCWLMFGAGSWLRAARGCRVSLWWMVTDGGASTKTPVLLSGVWRGGGLQCVRVTHNPLSP